MSPFFLCIVHQADLWPLDSFPPSLCPSLFLLLYFFVLFFTFIFIWDHFLGCRPDWPNTSSNTALRKMEGPHLVEKASTSRRSFSSLPTSWCKKKKRKKKGSTFSKWLFFFCHGLFYFECFFCTLNPRFSFLVYISVFFLIVFCCFFFNIVVYIYKNKLWTQESHFSCWSVLQKIQT